MTGFDSKRQMAQAKLEPTQWRDMVVVTLVREGIDKHKARELADHFAAQPEQEPVAHSVIAGALFDFMGWLTCRKERLVLSSVDDASPAVVAITEFAKMRGLSLGDARVQDWHIAPPAAQLEPTCPECKAGVLYECVACSNNNYPPKPEQEPVAKVVSTAPDRIWLDLGFDPQDEAEIIFDDLHDVTWSADNASKNGIEYVRATPPAAQPEQEPVTYDKTEMNGFVQELYDKKMQEGKHGHYETMFHVVHQAIKRVAQRPWVGLTDDDIAQAMYKADAIFTGPMQFKFAKELEAKLKEKNDH
jgi:hypothetical protein